MTDTAETIRVEIIAAAAQFRSELDTAIKKLVGPGGLKDALRDVPKEISVRVDIDTGAAKLTLDNFDARVKLLKDNVKRGWAVGDIDGVNKSVAELNRIEQAAKDAKRAARDVGGGIGGILNTVTGAAGNIPGGALPVAAGAAGVAAAGPPLLGAAAAGGAGLSTVLLGGLLPLMTLAKPALGDIKALSEAYTELKLAQEHYAGNQPAIAKAQAAYNAAVAAFGPSSNAALTAHAKLVLAQHAQANSQPQVVAAQEKLNKLMQESSPEALALAKAMSGLDSAMNDAGLKIVPQLAQVLTPLLRTFEALLPTIVRMAQIDLSGIARGLAPVLKMMESSAFKAMLVQLAEQFAKLMPIMLRWIGALLEAFVNLGLAGGPAMLKVAEAFTKVLEQVAKFTASKQFAPMINELVKSFIAWMQVLVPLLPTILKLVVAMTPASLAFAEIAKEILITDKVGAALAWTIKAMGDIFNWIVHSPLAILIPGIGELVGTVKLVTFVSEHFKEIWGAVWGGVKTAFSAVLNFLLGGFTTLLGAIAAVLRAADVNLPIVGHIFGTHLGEAAKAVEGAQHSIDEFRKGLAPAAADSTTKTGEIATAHQKASHQIVEAWGTALGATKKGIGEINAQMLAELKQLNGGKVVPLSQGGPPLAPGLVAINKAGGGYIGHPGERGHDEVPIVVGRGEAVLHAGHQAVVNQALANSGMHGGLAEVFSSTGGLHYNMAAGGFAGNVAGPGSGAIGAMVGMANRINSQHFPYLWGGGHNSSFTGPYDCSGAVSAVLHAGGFLNTPEVSGEFESYGFPGPGAVTLYANPTHVYMSLDGHFFGTSGSNVGGGAGWFQGAARPGFIVRHVDPKGTGGAFGGAGAAGISGIRAKGGAGQIGQVAQSAIDRVQATANRKLSSMGGVAGAAGGKFGGGQASENLENQAAGKAMMLAAGWPAGQWPFLQKLWTQESGWDANSVNSSSGAYGIPQALGHGHPYNLGDARSQIAWGLKYIRERYGSPAGAWAHEQSSNWYAGGGFVGGFAPGGKVPVGKQPRPAKRGQHPGTKRPASHKQPTTPKARPLKVGGLLASDIVGANVKIHADEVSVGNLGESYKHLLDTQALTPTEALVTLSDADVAFLDPGGHVDTAGNFIPGPLGYEQGDQIVNAHGMSVGRFFGPGGIAGGHFIAGIDTRTAQIGELTGLLGGQDAAYGREATAEAGLVPREQNAIVLKKQRETRMRRFLAVNVARAVRVKQQMEALTTGNLKANLASALSKGAIAGRKGELSTHLRALQGELAAEAAHQAGLAPLEREPGYGAAVKGQIAGVKAALSAEGELSSKAGSSTAIAHAREAILKNSLGHQLKDLTGENRILGGATETVGEGGQIGKLMKQVVALRADQTTHNEHLATLPPLRYELKQELGALTREQAALNAASPIQVRALPGALQPGAGVGEQQAQLNALLKQQLETTQTALSTSQAQFAVFQGFQPLLAGRLVGTFAQGVDRVARTGPAMVHAGEVILPDPNGPYGRQAVAAASDGQSPVAITLVMGNNEEPLMKLIQAQIRDRSLRVVTDHGGQRSRLMAGVTHH